MLHHDINKTTKQQNKNKNNNNNIQYEYDYYCSFNINFVVFTYSK